MLVFLPLVLLHKLLPLLLRPKLLSLPWRLPHLLSKQLQLLPLQHPLPKLLKLQSQPLLLKPSLLPKQK